MKEGICARPDCGAEFEVTKRHKRFCSTECKRTMERRQRVANRVCREILEKGATTALDEDVGFVYLSKNGELIHSKEGA